VALLHDLIASVRVFPSLYRFFQRFPLLITLLFPKLSSVINFVSDVITIRWHYFPQNHVLQQILLLLATFELPDGVLPLPFQTERLLLRL